MQSMEGGSPKILREVTVYCGSGPGNDPAYVQAGHDLGEIFCREHIRGKFGGGSIGVMGSFSSSMISHGGYVTAVIPRRLIEKEQPIMAKTGSTLQDNYELIITEDMYERKRLFRRADAFVALGGGAGTRDEIWEELTGIQIGDHEKPVVLVNTLGCFNHLIADIKDMRERQFIRPGLEFNGLFDVVSNVYDVVPSIRRMLGINTVVPIRAAG